MEMVVNALWQFQEQAQSTAGVRRSSIPRTHADAKFRGLSNLKKCFKNAFLNFTEGQAGSMPLLEWLFSGCTEARDPLPWP